MTQITCKYHPQAPARWACTHCHINFCPSCVPAPPPMKMPACPVCERDLESLGSGNLVKPFWTQIPRFFLYPAHPGPLAVMLLLIALGFVLSLTNFLIVLLGFIVLSFMFTKYCLVVLEDTAHGHVKPRAVSGEMLTGEMQLPGKLFLLNIALEGILYVVLSVLGPIVTLLAALLLIFSYPAIIMVLAMEHSFFKALNPLLVTSVMARIGFPYVIMVVLLYFLIGAAFTLIVLLGAVISPQLMGLISIFAGMYFVLIMYTMMGYVLYQYHDELGYEVEVEDHEAPASTASEAAANPALRAVEILIQEGKNEEAAARLEQLVRDNPADDEARQRLLILLRLMGEKARHLKQGQAAISYLTANNEISRATQVFRDCHEFDPAFRPARPQERLAVARCLSDNAQGKLAVAVTNNLHRDFPDFDGVPEAYLMVAQVLCEKFNQDDKAKQILNFILSKYPDHPQTGAAREYLQLVNRLGA